MLGHLMMSCHLIIWKVKIRISQERKELSRWKKSFFLVSQVLPFRHKKWTNKNVADTTFKVSVVTTCLHFNPWHILKETTEPAGQFHSLQGFPAPLFKASTSWPSLPPFFKSLCPLPSVLFHPFLRYFRQFPPPSRKSVLP